MAWRAQISRKMHGLIFERTWLSNFRERLTALQIRREESGRVYALDRS
jgi:hypothetical protein